MDKLPPIPGRKQCSFVNTSSGWRTGTVHKQVRYYAWVILMPIAERDRILPVNPPLPPPGTAQPVSISVIAILHHVNHPRTDRKSTRSKSSHLCAYRTPSPA